MAMELTPKVFRDVQFREKLRGGYHPEDVDEFLEQAALGVEALLDSLRQANERAQRAEQTASEATATDDTLRRMLLMAQRTADQAVKEARQEAEELVSSARAQADSILAEADERGRRAYESALTESRESMQKADDALQQAVREAEVLRSWVDVQKSQLLAVLRDAEALLEKAGLESEPPPVTSMRSGHSLPARGLAAPAGTANGAVDEGATGEWDPSYLEDLSGAQAEAHPARSAGEAEGDDPGPSQLAANGQDDQSGPVRRHGGLTEDTSMALDERALDSFFGDQDMEEERGLGRFRRHQ